jgi:hypothetical protein
MRRLERQVIENPQSYKWAARLFSLPTVDGRQTTVNSCLLQKQVFKFGFIAQSHHDSAVDRGLSAVD